MNAFLEFLRFNGWAVTAPLAVLIAVIGWILTIYLKSRKSIGWSAEITPVFTVGRTYRSDLEVKFKGRLIDDLYHCRVKIKNNGNVEFRESDFIEPLSIEFAEEATLLSAQIDKETTRPELIALSWEGTVVKIGLKLFNPRDVVDLTFAIDRDSTPRLIANIAGVGQPKSLNSKLRFYAYSFCWILVAIIVGANTDLPLPALRGPTMVAIIAAAGPILFRTLRP